MPNKHGPIEAKLSSALHHEACWSSVLRKHVLRGEWGPFDRMAFWCVFSPDKATAVYRIAQDLGSRIAVDAGLARVPDYRDELEQLIRSQFQTRRAFCQATGLSEDMLSHVLAGRKHLAIDTLTEALRRIGFTLRITPAEAAGPADHP